MVKEVVELKSNKKLSCRHRNWVKKFLIVGTAHVLSNTAAIIRVILISILDKGNKRCK